MKLKDALDSEKDKKKPAVVHLLGYLPTVRKYSEPSDYLQFARRKCGEVPVEWIKQTFGRVGPYLKSPWRPKVPQYDTAVES